ncbi:hypothetical protein LXD80_10150 [Enterobacter sp. ASE]|uniref:hypothetical protein n=1 Tax=Enterobacter sp. ASE TaxID=2905968 RepID=UPI001E5FD0DF|nr:hypothetical protein [Enterobacter sp. ASE]MCE3116161.1 hypothetical protein [Enterobacter sp. ASE]
MSNIDKQAYLADGGDIGTGHLIMSHSTISSKCWEYSKGNGRHFIRAPDWVTMRTRVNGGDAWLEFRGIGARFIAIQNKEYGILTVNRLPESGEEIIAVRKRTTRGINEEQCTK